MYTWYTAESTFHQWPDVQQLPWRSVSVDSLSPLSWRGHAASNHFGAAAVLSKERQVILLLKLSLTLFCRPAAERKISASRSLLWSSRVNRCTLSRYQLHKGILKSGSASFSVSCNPEWFFEDPKVTALRKVWKNYKYKKIPFITTSRQSMRL